MSSLQLPEPDPGQGYGPPPGLPQGLEDGSQTPEDPLTCLKEVIDDFPRLLTALQDPKHVEMAVTALKALASIQTQLMAPQGQSGPQTQP